MAQGLETIETYDTRPDGVASEVDFNFGGGRQSEGRDGKWAAYKRRAGQVALAFDVTEPKRSQRMRLCARRVQTVVVQGQRRVVSAQFCKDPLCPVCAWRKSGRLRDQALGVVRSHEGQQVLHQVLTLRSVPVLAGSVDRLWGYWRSLSRRVWFKSLLSGYLVTLEFTFHRDTGWHPHMHVLLLLRPGVQLDDGARKAFNDRVSAAWHLLSGDSFITRTLDRSNAVFEATKYVTDFSELLAGGESEQIRELAAEVKGRRMLARGGEFKVVKEELSDEEMLQAGGSDVDPEAVDAVESWEWNAGLGQYVLVGLYFRGDPEYESVVEGLRRRRGGGCAGAA